jgi:twitching motility protein PilT
MARLDYILRLMVSQEADGLRMSVGQAPELVYGKTARHLDIPAFNEKQLRDFVREISEPEDLARLHTAGSARLVYEFGGRMFACDIRSPEGRLEAEFRAVAEGSKEDDNTNVRRASEVEVTAENIELPEEKGISAAATLSLEDDEVSSPSSDAIPAAPAVEGDPDASELGLDHDPFAKDRVKPPVFGPGRTAARWAPLSGVDDETTLSKEPGTSPGQVHRSSAPSMSLPGRAAPAGAGAGTAGGSLSDSPSLRGSTPGGLRPSASISYTRAEATTPPDYGRKLNREEFHKLLRWMVEQDATDLHITPNFPPTLRVDNLFQPSQGRSFTPDEIEKVVLSILSPADKQELEHHKALDRSYDVEGLGRFRINIFRQMHGWSAAVRYVRSAIESLDELNLPGELNWLTGQETGLVLFTGPTGSGKSTTMAAIIEQMNVGRQLHILTLEAPIEFIFQNQKCLIQQREVGQHTGSFLDGLRDALRENPDVIMVGELRDLETVQMALSASETGHLILATVHANSTTNAISRLVEVFPDNQKAGARAMIADVLRAVVNLRLLRHSSGRGLIPSVEFLKNNNAVSTLIRENKLHQIRQVITTAASEGMWPFERHLVELFRRSLIDYDTAYQSAPDKKIFEQYAQAIGAGKGKVKKRAVGAGAG